MSCLVVIPTQQEFTSFLDACNELSVELSDKQIGRLACKFSAQTNFTIACGGLGKAQFAVSTQHLIDCGSEWELVICAGAAGALSDKLSVGDIVVGEETVEYDMLEHFGPPILPKFSASQSHLLQYQKVAAQELWSFKIHFGAIASGDQDVVDEQVQQEIVERTKAIAVAWEGAGGARACQFSQIPFVEIRGISDVADSSAPSDYVDNLPVVMSNIAQFLLRTL